MLTLEEKHHIQYTFHSMNATSPPQSCRGCYETGPSLGYCAKCTDPLCATCCNFLLSLTHNGKVDELELARKQKSSAGSHKRRRSGIRGLVELGSKIWCSGIPVEQKISMFAKADCSVCASCTRDASTCKECGVSYWDAGTSLCLACAETFCEFCCVSSFSNSSPGMKPGDHKCPPCTVVVEKEVQKHLPPPLAVLVSNYI